MLVSQVQNCPEIFVFKHLKFIFTQKLKLIVFVYDIFINCTGYVAPIRNDMCVIIGELVNCLRHCPSM
jgi:hypothetical protein